MIPTNLLVGDASSVQQIIIERLQKALCKNKSASCFCSDCRKIKNRQHPSVVWIEPEKNYLLKDLQIIFQKIRFSLDEGESFFFVIDKAQLLTPVCANKLLKTLEEPPAGYTFFLITDNEQSILPTIRSRCHIEHITATSAHTDYAVNPPLIHFFLDSARGGDPFLFDQELRNMKPTEYETVALMEKLIQIMKRRIIKFHKECESSSDIERLERDPAYKKLHAMHALFESHMKKRPQPGSAHLFWKKLFMQYESKHK